MGFLAPLFKSGKKKTKIGSNHGNWKGGRKAHCGYIHAYCPDHPNAIRQYILEHRLVMEKRLGRFLEPHEIVHHLDGNKCNNLDGNLELTTRGGHRKTYSDGYNQGHLDCALKFLIENINTGGV